MNRHQQRARSAMMRQRGNDNGMQPVSAKLLQKRLAEQSAELQQLRNVLFSIVKEQGRIKFQKATLDSLGEADGLDAREELGVYIIEYKKVEVTP